MGEVFGDKSALSLFKRGYKHGAFDEEVDGPLHWAIQEKFNEAALYLIQEAGEDTNRLDSNQRSPLEVAIEKNLFDVFKALVNKANVNLVNANNQSFLHRALHWALEEDYLDVFKALIEKADVNYVDDLNYFSILDMAVFHNKYKYVEMLIEMGANVNCVNQSNKGPLHLAAHFCGGATDIAKILIKNGAEIDAKTNNGLQSPLHFASSEGHQEVVKLLLENGATHDIKDIDDNEPIHYASALGHNQCVEILIQHGAYLNTRGRFGLTPLQRAINKNHTVSAQILLNYGASFNFKDSDHFYPMERAMANKNLDIFKLLVFFEP